MSALSVADVLDRAADLIEPEGAWWQGGYYGSRERRECVARAEADCFCVVGAMTVAAGRSAVPRDIEQGEIGKALAAVLPTDALGDGEGREGIYVWNDAPGRTQAEVVAKLREAAAIAKAHSASPSLAGGGE